jgi:hypothetical protein
MAIKFEINDLSALVPSIRKNFQLYETDEDGPTGFKCLHCGEILPKRTLAIASHDSDCGGKENNEKIRNLEIRYNNDEITIDELNAAARKIFEIEDDQVLLYDDKSFRAFYINNLLI